MRVLGVVGKIFIGAGVIILLFAAYQVWGTTLQEEHTQATLRTDLVHETKSKAIQSALKVVTTEDKLPTGPATLAAPTTAPAEGMPVADIRIPVIGINQVVVEGTNTQDLRKGPGHYDGTPLPGQPGNVAIAGHRTTYGHPFYNLNNVAIGDPIVLTTVQGVFVYDAVKSEVVAPNDNSPLQDLPGGMLTLTTCNPRFSASSRLVVVAKLMHSELFAATASNKGTSTDPKGSSTKSSKQKPDSGDLAGASDGQLLTAVLWGLVVAALGIAVLLVAHRYRRQRWLIWVVGTGGVLVLLYFFFAAVTPLLPASL